MDPLTECVGQFLVIVTKIPEITDRKKPLFWFINMVRFQITVRDLQ